MDDGMVPRTRNLRPRKPYVDPFAQPRRSVRRARARLSAADFYVLDNDDDGDWNGAADDEVGDEEVVDLNLSSRRSNRSHRRTSGRRESTKATRATPEPSPKKRTRKPKVLLPEDVPFREPVKPQPEADPEDIIHAPSIAFIAIFIATFPSLFEDLGRLPSPQDLEAGLVAPEPSELVEFIFRRMLGCVLNRKKEIEVGRYASALSELHAQRNTLGMGPLFPPLQWKSKGNAFAELKWYDRLELLHVLVHWSLSASDRVRQLLRQLDDEAVNPWFGADEAGNHYYIVGFDPIAEGAEEHTPFRVYKESNRLLQTVKWEPVASTAAEVQAFLDSHIKRPVNEAEGKQTNSADGGKNHVSSEQPSGEDVKSDQKVELEPQGDSEEDGASESSEKKAGVEQQLEPQADPEPQPEPAPVEYHLPQPVVDTLLYFLPAMYRSEEVALDRLQKEAKRARRRNDIMWQAENISNGGGRYAGRTRGRKINYAELLRDTIDEDEDEQPRKRRLRQRDTNYEWREPEPETRQQRHARIMAERAAERANWSSKDVSVEATPEYTASGGHTDATVSLDVHNESLKTDASEQPSHTNALQTQVHTSAEDMQKPSYRYDASDQRIPNSLPLSPDVRPTIAGDSTNQTPSVALPSGNSAAEQLSDTQSSVGTTSIAQASKDQPALGFQSVEAIYPNEKNSSVAVGQPMPSFQYRDAEMSQPEYLGGAQFTSNDALSSPAPSNIQFKPTGVESGDPNLGQNVLGATTDAPASALASATPNVSDDQPNSTLNGQPKQLKDHLPHGGGSYHNNQAPNGW